MAPEAAAVRVHFLLGQHRRARLRTRGISEKQKKGAGGRRSRREDGIARAAPRPAARPLPSRGPESPPIYGKDVLRPARGAPGFRPCSAWLIGLHRPFSRPIPECGTRPCPQIAEQGGGHIYRRGQPPPRIYLEDKTERDVQKPCFREYFAGDEPQ